MAFHYLIDGYNVIYAWPEIPPGAWELKREFLLRFLKTQKPQGNNPVTVVFDSRVGTGNRSTSGSLFVVYTAGESADDWISHKVREAANPRTLVVVSNDKGIRHMVRGTGARFLSADEFLKPKAGIPTSPPRKPKLDARDDITEEFKKKWL
jgi:predicted RNA-binding protein with PIN domain